MNKFEELCQTASDTNVDIIDYPFTSKRIKGLYCDGTIALSKRYVHRNRKSLCACRRAWTPLHNRWGYHRSERIRK